MTESLPAVPAGPETGYYGLPLLKKPVWTWEVPAYFFVGGAAGAGAVIAEMTRLGHDGDAVRRDARWIAGAGAVLSAPLLIADLGRPERFLNMLRVFKPQSPMSVGAWILLAFSSAAAAALAAQEIDRRLPGRYSIAVIENTAGSAAAVLGPGMAAYTGVLLGVTAVPVWSRHARMLPLHFAFAGLATAVSLLQLRGHRHPALNRLGLAAAAVETFVGARIEAAARPAGEPARRGASGTLMRAAGALSGPVPLLLRAAGRRSSRAQRAASAATIVGSVLTRYAWIAAGRRSAADPRDPLRLDEPKQRGGITSGEAR
jgi:formate-dependent nitrite reductase membrane component NrfD